jgi:phage recombination protein Bet
MSEKGKDLQIITGDERKKLIAVLGNSLYLGAKDESIDMVLAYCEAAKLDVMQKPVHIVPMSVKKKEGQGNEFRDVIMPGIGLYRIQADRSGTMAGITEPEYGPMITETFKAKSYDNKPPADIEVTYPEWCKVIVKKIVGAHIVDFVSKEYWVENYATQGGNSTAPNAMWLKRSRGQLAKCAEAQALRKAFPEVGAQPTAEEMEGKIIDVAVTAEVELIEDNCVSDEEFEKMFPKVQEAITAKKWDAAKAIEWIESKGKSLCENHINQIKNIKEGDA